MEIHEPNPVVVNYPDKATEQLRFIHPEPSEKIKTDPSKLSMVVDYANLYESQLKLAQIGMKRGPLYEEFKKDSEHMINVDLEGLRKAGMGEDEIEQARARKLAAVEKRSADLANFAENTRKYAREDLEAVRKPDPEFAAALEKFCGDLEVKEPIPLYPEQPLKQAA